MKLFPLFKILISFGRVLKFWLLFLIFTFDLRNLFRIFQRHSLNRIRISSKITKSWLLCPLFLVFISLIAFVFLSCGWCLRGIRLIISWLANRYMIIILLLVLIFLRIIVRFLRFVVIFLIMDILIILLLILFITSVKLFIIFFILIIIISVVPVLWRGFWRNGAFVCWIFLKFKNFCYFLASFDFILFSIIYKYLLSIASVKPFCITSWINPLTLFPI